MGSEPVSVPASEAWLLKARGKIQRFIYIASWKRTAASGKGLMDTRRLT